MLSVKLGFFPLDRQLELWEKNWSEGLVKEAVWLSGSTASFELAEQIFERVAQVSMSDSTIWRRVERWGEQFRELEQARQEEANRLAQIGEVLAPQSKSAARMGVGMDGAMIHIRQEGWKELKVGCVFDIEVRPIFDKETKEWVEQGHARNNSYLAHLGGPAQFGEMLWATAKQCGWEQCYDTQAIGDGAPWIWNLTNLHFYDSLQTLDFYHSSEHLTTSARLLFPTNPAAAQRWFNKSETLLFQGHSDQIAASLTFAASANSQRHKDLLTQADYFLKHKRRMQYLEFREDGFPIGSGTVESEAKQFKARFCGPGMRWSRQGAERLIPIRSSIMSHHFDSLWPSVYNSPQN